VAAIAIYPFVSFDTKSLIYSCVSSAVVVALIIGVIAYRPATRAPWLLLACAFGATCAGDLVYSAMEHSGPVPFPSYPDALYLAFYPLACFAVGRFVAVGGHRDRSAWIVSAMWTMGAGVVVWLPFVKPNALEEGSLYAAAVATAYPMLDLTLLLLVIRLINGPHVRNTACTLLAFGLMLQMITDSIYGVRVLAGTYVSGEWLDLGWMTANVAVGACALHASMATLSRFATRPAAGGRRRLLALGIPALSPSALLIFLLATDRLTGAVVDGVVVVFASAVAVVLGLIRARGLLAVAEARAADLTARVERDELTGLSSRSYFVEALGAALAKPADERAGPSVIFLDVDDFKTVNDTLGHEAGDRLLVEVAERLRTLAAPGRVVARFGGDEFAVLLEGSDETYASSAAEALLDAFGEPVVLDGRELRIEVSIGVTTAVDDNCDAGDMLRRADVAMYSAKRLGSSWATYQEGMSALIIQRLDLRARLAEALRAGEIQPWFQPIADLQTDEVIGFEALARWSSHGRPAVPPAAWLPLAEETGLIVDVDRAVIRRAIDQLAAWRRDHGAFGLSLAINLSGRTLQEPGIDVEILRYLARAEVPPHRLTVEITEGVLIEGEEVGRRLQVLRAAGVRISLDDFGTGWSSLSYLRRFPVDQLKLDGTFTAELGQAEFGTDPSSEAIPAAVIHLARSLSLTVIAEGVETREQRNHLARMGFTAGQGFLFGVAAPGNLLGPAVRAAVAPHLAADLTLVAS
jgi:diguanylate cyclase (GGDEF)-like protein